jgi:phosphate transport system ATP-binding protein
MTEPTLSAERATPDAEPTENAMTTIQDPAPGPPADAPTGPAARDGAATAAARAAATNLSISPAPAARDADNGTVTAVPGTPDDADATPTEEEPAVVLDNVSIFYGSFRAVKEITFDVRARSVTALIGPSGSGKSTLLRAINRMNELIAGTRVEGRVLYRGEDLYDPRVDPVEVRRRIGMVFQKPNPFPKSIYDNVAFGPRLNGYRGNLDELVEQSLRRAALWNDVKDKLRQSGLALSGGQQQRLCIARAIAVEPELILMDEPASALDPKSTLQIEELMHELKQEYTILIVTHNMQQAARASDRTVFMNMADDRAGYVVEQGPTLEIFTNPKHQLTEDYVSGRFG